MHFRPLFHVVEHQDLKNLMSQMNDIDLRRGKSGGVGAKRSTDFPACACDSLRLVDKTIRFGSLHPSKVYGQTRIADFQGGLAGRPNMPEVQSTLDQDLFCLAPDRRGTRLNPIQELKLLDVLCSYFQEKATIDVDSRLRQASFEVIFLGREGETALHEARIGLLTKLCSLAVQYPCHSLLSDVASWFQNVGPGKPYVRGIVDRLLADFCTGAPLVEGGNASGGLKVRLDRYLEPLVNDCPDFACFLLILGWQTLTPTEARTTHAGFVRVTAEWLNSGNDDIGGGAGKLLAVLKGMEKTQTGVTLIAALCNEVFPKLVSLVCLPSDQSIVDDERTTAALHTGLLRLMLAVEMASLDSGPLALLDDRELVALLQGIAGRERTRSADVDRVAQLVQVAVSTQCFAGNKERIKTTCNQLSVKHMLLDHALS